MLTLLGVVTVCLAACGDGRHQLDCAVDVFGEMAAIRTTAKPESLYPEGEERIEGHSALDLPLFLLVAQMP
jgi:hypothetical protein